jgi:uncharacterized phiE125 gp8 family phage protein
MIPTRGVTLTPEAVVVEDPAPAPAEQGMAVQSFGAFAALVESVDDSTTDSSTGEPITLDEAKAHLRVVGSDDDAYILSLIVTARQMAEGRLNRTIVSRQRTEVFEPGETRFRLLKPPIVSVDSVEVTDYARFQTLLTNEEYYLHATGDGSTVRLRAAPGSAWSAAAARGTVAVTYTAGYAPGQVPRPIIQWMLLVIGTLYGNRETMSAGVQIFDMPPDFMKWLLQPYKVYE